MLAADLRSLLADKEAENARLREDLSATRAEIARMREASEAQSRELLAKISQLTDAVAKGNDRISELLVIALRKKAPPPKPPVEAKTEPPPEVSPSEADAFAERPIPPPLPEKLVPEPKPRKPTGRSPLPKHLLADESTVRPDGCGICNGTNLDVIDVVVEEKLTVVQQHQRRRVTRRTTCRCRDCGARTTAEAPPSPFERSKVTGEWLAWFVVEKFAKLVPLDRTRRYLGVQGLALAMSFLVSQVEAAAELLDGVDGEHWKQLLAGDYIASDATGLKVQIPKLGLHHGHIEVYHSGDIVVFQYEAEKGAKTQASKLADFEGVLQVDAESRYNDTFKNGLILEAGCNAHPRRKIRDAEKAQPVLALEAGRFIGAMYGAEEEARDLGLVGDELREWRQAKIRPILDDFEAWIDAVEPTLILSDPLAKVIRYCRNHRTALSRFVDDPRIPIDNSASEREFQHVAKLRLNSLFAGGTEGAHRAAVLLGIVGTCRRLKVDPQAYMTWAFERLGTHKAKYKLSAAELTPAAYKRTLTP